MSGILRVRLVRVGVPALLLAMWLGSGFYAVEPEELAAVKRFGAVRDAAVPSGWHWRLPWPFESHEKFETTTVYKMGVGLIAVGILAVFTGSMIGQLGRTIAADGATVLAALGGK